MDDNGLDRAIAIIVQRAVHGLNKTLDTTHKKAVKYAPVRAIFRRTGRSTQFPSINIRAGTSPAGVMRAYRRHPIATAAQYEQWKASRPPVRRIDVPAARLHFKVERDKFGIPTNMKPEIAKELERIEGTSLRQGPLYGHSNSMVPVIRTKDETIAGDFRQWDRGKLRRVAQVTQRKGGKPFPQGSDLEGLITSAGRYEIRTGRAVVARIGAKDGVSRVGGALRHSIVKVSANPNVRNRRGKVYGYVRAGGPGVEYAKYQEHGSRHNRAQPFLRPALYESRVLLKKNVYEAISRQKLKV